MKCRLLVIVLTGTIAFAILLQGCDDPGQAQPDAGTVSSSRLSRLLSPDDASGYALALQPRAFSFPEDHGPHPEYRNEWWYITGNLDADNGDRFGFELTIFRFSLAPPRAAGTVSPAESSWSTDQVYIGHFALTDAAAEQFHVAERYSRGALELAGARAKPFRVWVEDWLVEEAADGGAWNLHASDGEIELSLSLDPIKSPVLNGSRGLSQKSPKPGNASYYYSIPRLAADGSISIGDVTRDVSGLAWLDREWGSSALSPEQEGWDWFALQLSDGSDLMYYNLRRSDGSNDPHSAGTWTPPGGNSLALSDKDVRIVARDYWDSPKGGRYPVAWSVSVPRLSLELEVDPVLEAQELDATVRYWEGAVDVAGAQAGRPLTGRGYVELTGYARD